MKVGRGLRFFVIGAGLILALGLTVFWYLKNTLLKPVSDLKLYITEAEKNEKFIGPEPPYELTNDELRRFTAMADSQDKFAAAKLALYYLKTGQRELAHRFLRISGYNEDNLPYYDRK